MMTWKWMSCPKCGGDGTNAKYFDRIIDKWVTEFCCDNSKEHHYMIIELKPTIYVECQDDE